MGVRKDGKTVESMAEMRAAYWVAWRGENWAVH
jgi:hypothetical protein